MKVLIELSNKEKLYLDKVDGVILPLKKYSVESSCFFTLEEIKDITKKYSCEVFVKINKNFMNEEIDDLSKILIELNKLPIKGILFYDIALLQLKKDLNLDIKLVWNQTHMVNNYKTCNYYYSRGVSYALLGKEITLEEIKEIIQKSNISCMVEVIGKPSVAFSKRKLISHYYQNMGMESEKEITVREKVTDTNYHLREDENGTSFFLDIITNGTGVIKELYLADCPYIIIKENGLENIFDELLTDTMEYIAGKCEDEKYVSKYKKLGDCTNFFFKKTIYRVKKNG